jgi:hypothetical protein
VCLTGLPLLLPFVYQSFNLTFYINIYINHSLYFRYLATQQAIVTLQTRVRAWRAARLVRTRYLRHRHAATVLQAWVRGRRERGRYERVLGAVRVIQEAWRGREARREAGRRRWAVGVLQQRTRAWIEGRKVCITIIYSSSP